MPENDPPSASAGRDLTTISLAFFLAFVGTGASQPYVTDFLTDERGLGPHQAAFVLSLVYLAFVVFRFFIGFILDVTGLHLGKILGISVYALFPLIVSRTGSYPVMLAGSVLWGLGAPMLWTSSLVQVMNASGPKRFGSTAGIVRGTVLTAVFVGHYMLGWIYQHHGYRALFTTASVLGGVAVVVMVLSPKRSVEREKPDVRKFVHLMARGDAKAVCLFLLCSGLGYGLLLNGMKGHVETVCGTAWLKTILPFFALAGIVSSFIGGWICDRVGRWPTFAWGFLIGALGLTLAWAFTAPAALMLALLFIGVQFAVVPLAALAWVGDTSGPGDRASVMGYAFCFRDFGIGVAILISGLIPSTRTAFIVFAGAFLFCAAVAFVAWGGTRAKRPESAKTP
ncbi:MAG: MFS transporter [bacterium]|nr:MFS transporter [bacterium]